MKTLYLAWQDPVDRSWQPVGRLTGVRGQYHFVYTRGALHPRFKALGNMEDLHKRYESTELFPLFANRIVPKSRPEYRKILDWLNLNETEDHPLQLLALTEGIRKTDTLMVFPCPEEQKDGTALVRFFSHGIRHLSEASIAEIDQLEAGSRLYLMRDVQNPHDALALALRTGDPAAIVGYCPRYLAADFGRFIEQPNDVEVSVERVNADAPTQLRLLCTLTTPWPEDFAPCSGDLYQPLAS